ncbi:XkdX family protein [Listeria sp. FSL L7-1582]|nr:XkdX family protein [Listeria portnoyi]MBC6310968.1 XkdX family protein [Listeria portnoyi]
MLDWYKLIKRYYEGGFYTKDQVQRFVELSKITQEEANEILGEAV